MDYSRGISIFFNGICLVASVLTFNELMAQTHQLNEINSQYNPNDLVLITAPPAQDVPQVLPEQTIEIVPQNNQVRLKVDYPRYDCPRQTTESDRIQACLAREPSPIGNIVLDVGHGDFTDESPDSFNKSSDRSPLQNYINEGQSNMVTSLMAQDMLRTCYGFPSEKLQLTRYPGEVEFGEFHNTRYANEALERFERNGNNEITSELDEDSAQRGAFINHLMELHETDAKNSLFVSVHANAAGGDYVAVFHEPRDEESEDFSRRLLNSIVSQTQDQFNQALSKLQTQKKALLRRQVEQNLHRDVQINEQLDQIDASIQKLMNAKHTKLSQGGTSKVIGDDQSRKQVLELVPKNSPKALTEGYFMDGILGQMANDEIKKNKDALNELKLRLTSSTNDNDREDLENQIKSLKKRSNLSVTQEVYNSETGQWTESTVPAIDYDVAKIFVNYAKGLSMGLVSQLLSQCSETRETQ